MRGNEKRGEGVRESGVESKQMARGREEKPLRRIAESFKELADSLKGSSRAAEVVVVGDLDVGPFSLACSHVSVLFSTLGIAFKFAQHDYVSKVYTYIHVVVVMCVVCVCMYIYTFLPSLFLPQLIIEI